MPAAAGTPLPRSRPSWPSASRSWPSSLPTMGASWAAPDRQSIGGVFACNLAGPRRIKAGAARDHLLGLQCVTGTADHQDRRPGDEERTGYDLCKLLAGSCGTLAVMSQVTFKVLPGAENEGTLLLAGARRRGAGHHPSGDGNLVRHVECCLLPALAAARSCVVGGTAGGRARLRLPVEGPGPSVAYRAGAARGRAGGCRRDGAPRRGRQPRRCGARSATCACSAEPHAMAAVAAADGGGELAGGPRSSRRSAVGLGRRAALAGPAQRLADAHATVRAALADRGGHATLVRADEELRRRCRVFEPQPPALAALTQPGEGELRPEAILNPGRMYPGL